MQRILASQHDAGTVYVAYENHQNGDFKPYIIKSSDKGKTWVNIAGNLPERGGVYALAEDHVNQEPAFRRHRIRPLFTIIGGEKWIKLNVGLPTILVRDLAIQKQMDDLVIGTFGRSIYVLDDYSPLRVATAEMLQKESVLFPVRSRALVPSATTAGGDLGDRLLYGAESAGRRGHHLPPEGGHPDAAAGACSSASAPPCSAARRRPIRRRKSCAPKRRRSRRPWWCRSPMLPAR